MKIFRLSQHLGRFITFGTVSLVGLAIQVSLFWVLHDQEGIRPLIAGGTASFIALFINFLLNRSFTWRDRARKDIRGISWQATKYYTVIAVGYGVYFLVFWALLRTQLLPVYSNLIAVFASGGSNFLLHSLWTFGRDTNTRGLNG